MSSPDPSPAARPLIFMMGVSPVFLPVDRLYARNHMWAMPFEGGYRCGFSAYAVRLLGEVRHLQWSFEPPADVTAGQQIGFVEASKATSDLYAPMAGRITQVNPEVLAHPALLGSNLYDSGWLLTMRGRDAKLLLSAEAYRQLLEAAWPLAQRLLKGQVARRQDLGD